MVTRYAFADAHATSVEDAVVLDGVIEKGKTTDVAEAINQHWWCVVNYNP